MGGLPEEDKTCILLWEKVDIVVSKKILGLLICSFFRTMSYDRLMTFAFGTAEAQKWGLIWNEVIKDIWCRLEKEEFSWSLSNAYASLGEESFKGVLL